MFSNPVAGKAAWFTDIASRSNFPYRTNNDFTGRKYFPQPMCGGVAVIDYNNDGLMDLFFTNGSELPGPRKSTPAYYNALLKNRGDGTFEDVTATAGLSGASLAYSFGVAAAGYDNRANADVLLQAPDETPCTATTATVPSRILLPVQVSTTSLTIC